MTGTSCTKERKEKHNKRSHAYTGKISKSTPLCVTYPHKITQFITYVIFINTILNVFLTCFLNVFYSIEQKEVNRIKNPRTLFFQIPLQTIQSFIFQPLQEFNKLINIHCWQRSPNSSYMCPFTNVHIYK